MEPDNFINGGAIKYIFVGGNFDENNGRPSSLAAAIHRGLASVIGLTNGVVYNGGSLEELAEASELTRTPGVAVIWLANVPNEHPKTSVRSLKAQNQTCLLVTSKRSVDKTYDLPEVIQHALRLKSNLVILFNKPEGTRYRAKLLDPLGNIFCDTFDFYELGVKVGKRLQFLASVIRINTAQIDGPAPVVPEETAFFRSVRTMAHTFSELLPSPVKTERFVGNAAFRCAYGFPSFRNNDTIFTSRRNVDKTLIGSNSFVPVMLLPDKPVAATHTNTVYRYFGEHKPSVDTPIQARLFAAYPRIKYLIHGHVYVIDAKFTDRMWPCGAFQESYEIIQTVAANHADELIGFVINLVGHGFIAGAENHSFFDTLKFESRPFPEQLNTQFT